MISFSNNFFLFYFISAILQQTTVGIGQIKFQGVATCLFLCMDACGTIYGAVNIFIFFSSLNYIHQNELQDTVQYIWGYTETINRRKHNP